MLDRAINIIKWVSNETDRVILFHSGSGKDSIALLDLLHPYFREIVVVYMYAVKDLEHISRYLSYARRKYPKARIVQTPHYSVYSYRKYGSYGCRQIESQRLRSLADINKMIREKTGIEWTCFGFKQSDSMNRRLMLRTYEKEAINIEQKKFFPLSQYKNNDIIEYIRERNLITPESYGNSQSQGCNITDYNYLNFLRKYHPSDYKKTVAEYPLVERIIFEHDYEENKGK